ncbi:FtsK/SpoIIIE domain-containing protein [Liquorilactobacillus satsumensis]|uniref:FtsK/SpoIIIE domain-containing protein n=1 Tax=Liquorilactobacillus satsumensis TaxID=259059 RepID=UPI00345C6BC8
MFKYKGIRIRRFHRDIVFIYLSLMSLPFTLLSISFLYLVYARSPDKLIWAALAAAIFAFCGAIISFAVYKRSDNHNGFFTRVKHRQLLARMIIDNKLYLAKNRNRNNPRQKIIYFPKIYYHYKELIITVRFPMDLQKNQDKFNRIGEQLEQALFADLFDIIDEKGFKAYKLINDPIQNRINITDTKPDSKEIELMHGFTWDYNKFPHALISGVTGGGKTYFIQALLKSFIDLGANCYICDPKMSDLSQLDQIPILEEKVFSSTGQINKCVREFYEQMVERQKEYKQLLRKVGEIGKDYRSFNMQPKVLFFDEYVAHMSNLDFKEQEKTLGYLKQIILLGRQLGFFLVAGMQRPDAKYFEDGMRDQFGLRISLGQMSRSGYIMMFGESDKNFKVQSDKVRGWGYVSIGGAYVRAFFAPFVPSEFSFYNYLLSKDEPSQLSDQSRQAIAERGRGTPSEAARAKSGGRS